MEKILIIYRSLLGTSRQYAEWLAKDLGVKAVDFKSVRSDQIEEAEMIVFMGGTYAGWLSLGGYIRKVWGTVQGKKVIFVNVGLAPETDPSTQESWSKLPQDFRDRAKLFKIPGKIGSIGEKEVKRDNLDRVIKAIRKEQE